MTRKINKMIPFLVADRPASLRIIKGANINGTIGIMSHANTTAGFQSLFKNYPCRENPCHAIDPDGQTNCSVSYDSSKCKVALSIQQRTIKMCDCGMFTKEGAQFSYPNLFQTYENMGANYGIMMDVFQDKDATIDSAMKALSAYKQQNYTFKLVLVAQGKSAEEYLYCYESLLKMGGEYIAIGGLLQRRDNTVRFVNVRSEDFMVEVLRKIRYAFNPSWLFALGCYHPNRHHVFEELGLWGSDYKGWIFQYKKRERLIQSHWDEIKRILSNNQLSSEHKQLVSNFKYQVESRAKQLESQEEAEYKTSRRNLTIDDREQKMADLDKELMSLLLQIFSSINLDGARPALEQHSSSIQDLTSITEQQIRFRQVRKIIESL